MLDEILIPTPQLTEAEVQRLAKVETAPYSLEDVEDVGSNPARYAKKVVFEFLKCRFHKKLVMPRWEAEVFL